MRPGRGRVHSLGAAYLGVTNVVSERSRADPLGDRGRLLPRPDVPTRTR